MSFLFGALARLLGEEVSGQKSEECNCYRLPGSGRIALRECFLLAASKTTRRCHSVCEER
jgi:hypothetical protein